MHVQKLCRNLNLGLATKARVYKVASQKGTLGVTFTRPGSAKECEGMIPHTPIVGVGVSNGLLNFQRAITRVKTHQFEEFFISLQIY
jgi:hypothetical protein